MSSVKSSSSRRGSTMTPTMSRARASSGVSSSQDALKAIEKTAMLMDQHSPDVAPAPVASSVAPKRFAFEEELGNVSSTKHLLCQFPKDDLSVIAFAKRDHGGLGPDVESEEFKKLDPSGAETISFLRAPWRIVVRNNAQFKSSEEAHATEDGSKMDLAGALEPDQPPNVDGSDIKADPISVECFRDESILASAAQRRELDKGAILVKSAIQTAHFTTSTGEAAISGRVIGQGPPKDPTTLKVFNQGDFLTRIMVKPKSFALGMGLFEPLFFRMAIYDSVNCSKVSEDVSFELNSPQVKNLVPSLARQDPHPVLSHLQFVFQVVPSAALHLVVIISKIPDLDGDSTSIYTQASGGTALSERQRANVAEFCFHNGRFSQLFAFSAIRLFGDNNTFLLDEPVSMTDFRLFTPKTNLIEEMASLHPESAPGSRVSARIKAKSCLNGAKLDLLTMKLPTGRLNMSRNMYDSSMRRIMLSESDSKEKILDTLPLYVAADFPVQPMFCPMLELVHNCYVYPIKADLVKFFSSKEARGLSQVITVRVSAHDSDSDPNASGLPVFFGRGHESTFVDSVTCCIASGTSTKALHWNEELKVKLPLNLSSKFHFRFTLLSLSKQDDNLESVIGYAVLFLAPGIQSEHVLRVAFTRKVPVNYTKQSSDAIETLGTITVHTKVISTLLPLDPALSSLYHVFHFKEFFMEDESRDALDAIIRKFNIVEAIKHLPGVVHCLVRMMCGRSNGAHVCEALLTVLARVSRELGTLHRPRQGLLQSFTEYGLNMGQNVRFPVHFALCSNFLVLLMMRGKEAAAASSAKRSAAGFLKSPQKKELEETDNSEESDGRLGLDEVYSLSWWVFDVSYRSIVLDQEDELSSSRSRCGVGSLDFLRVAIKLASNAVKIIAKCVKVASLTATVQFNACLGTFLLDLLSICDRGYVIDMIWAYLTEMIQEQTAVVTTIVPLLKYDVVRIVSEYEHFIAANFPARLKGKGNDEFLDLHQLTHAFSTAVVHDVFAAAKSCVDGASEAVIKARTAVAHYGVHVLLGAIAKHLADARFQDGRSKERIAQVYVPFLLVLIKEWNSSSGVLKDVPALMGLRRNVYLIVMWILEGLKRSTLKAIWRNLSDGDFVVFWQVIEDCLAAFAFVPGWHFESLSSSATARSLFERFAFVSSSSSSEYGRNFCAHVTLRILDLMEECCNSLEGDIVTDCIGSTLVALLSHNQGDRVLKCVFDTLHSFSLRFRRQMWRPQATSPFVQGLMGQLLRHCNSARDYVRSEAVVMIYLILRGNRAEMGNFQRSKVLSTTALASLVATGQIQGGSLLKRAMSTLSQYAMIEYQQAPEAVSTEDRDLTAKAEFAQSVQTMSRGLCRVLDDTIKVANVKQKEDANTIAELYYEIVKGYDSVADLRITWLRSLADFHKEKGCDAEAGMCMMRAAMLALNFLSQLPSTPSSIISGGKALFAKLLPGIEEYADMTGDESCQTSWFTFEGYATILEEGAACFTRAQIVEFAESIYLLALIPLREHTNAFAKIAACHRNLAALYQKLDSEGTTRFLGRYFRVGFYGVHFGAINGQEFVYRGPGAKHLFELKDELVEHFEKKFSTTVEIAKDSSPVPASMKESLKPMIQITSLRAIFDVVPGSLPAQKHLSEWIGVSKFAFDTPFQKSGSNKAQASSSADQWKRTTILETRHCFPGVLCRQIVAGKSEVEISPIELAVEAISSRSAMLKQEATRSVVNPLQLQQLLAGSVSVSVNSGPIEFCETFLKKAENFDPVFVAQLIAAFKEFLSVCQSGLVVNKKVTEASMSALHEQMEIDYKKLEAQLLPFLVGKLTHDQKQEEE